jgi:hypothetical protein
MKTNKPRTYTTEQFRAGLESEATKRCEAQAETIRKLMEENKALRARIENLLESQKADQRVIDRLCISIRGKMEEEDNV